MERRHSAKKVESRVNGMSAQPSIVTKICHNTWYCDKNHANIDSNNCIVTNKEQYEVEQKN